MKLSTTLYVLGIAFLFFGLGWRIGITYGQIEIPLADIIRISLIVIGLALIIYLIFFMKPKNN